MTTTPVSNRPQKEEGFWEVTKFNDCHQRVRYIPGIYQGRCGHCKLYCKELNERRDEYRGDNRQFVIKSLRIESGCQIASGV